MIIIIIVYFVWTRLCFTYTAEAHTLYIFWIGDYDDNISFSTRLEHSNQPVKLSIIHNSIKRTDIKRFHAARISRYCNIDYNVPLSLMRWFVISRRYPQHRCIYIL